MDGIVTGLDLYHALFGDDDSTYDYHADAAEEDSASNHRAFLAALVQMTQEVSAASLAGARLIAQSMAGASTTHSNTAGPVDTAGSNEPLGSSRFVLFQFCRNDKTTWVSSVDSTETLRMLKGRCCNVPSSEVFRVTAEELDALVNTKTKVMMVTIGSGDTWTESYESCKSLTVAQIWNGLGTKERRPMPIPLKFTIVDIPQKSPGTHVVYESDSGEGAWLCMSDSW
jgi:hypothetical protein